MKKWRLNRIKQETEGARRHGIKQELERSHKQRTAVALWTLCCILMCGCGGVGEQPEEPAAEQQEQTGEQQEQAAERQEQTAEQQEQEQAAEQTEQQAQTAAELPETGLAYESAVDTRVDIPALQEENPDVFGWLYIPGTDIDFPVLQSEQADDYYESHDAYGIESEEGTLYTELANGKNMCDFMTVVHGKCSADGTEGQFAQLYQFLDRDFFEENTEAYFYIDGNLLTYRIFAAYEREDTSLLRSYDFSYLSGCQQFLDDFYGDRQMGKNLREGWEGLTPSHFLLAFTTTKDTGKQLVVLAALTDDAAGTIKRAVLE